MKDFFERFIVPNRRVLILLLHVLAVAATYTAAFLLRFEFVIVGENLTVFLQTLPVLLVIRIGVLCAYGLHRGLWRYAGMDDLVRIVKVATISTVLFMAAVGFLFHMRSFPRSVFVIDWVLCVLVLGGKRFSIRLLFDWMAGRGRVVGGDATLIAGAGRVGAEALRLLRSTPGMQRSVVGFLDDNPDKRGASIHGCRVIGTLADAPDRIRALRVKEVLIAMSTAPKEAIRALVERCAGLQVRFRILPAMEAVMTGRIDADSIREVSLEDLLGREPVSLDRARVGEVLSAECVLITGAAGSIGSEIARQVAAHGARRLVLADIAESPLFHIDREIAGLAPRVTREAVVADIRDPACLDALFARVRPERVFHAAAYKHVPLMQAHPVEAVWNNVFGTRNLAEVAERYGVRKFVLISTDKAVHPTNVMGASKRVAEMVVSRRGAGATRFVAVRFGNVLGSNGSVIPIFKRQIAAGGPVTVTHPEMTRFFMTIPEAVELVLQAGALESAEGDLFFLDMGVQIRIRDLAENLIRLSGRVPGRDILIEYVGLRPGEKLSEELAAGDEEVAPTSVSKLKALRRAGAGGRDERFEEALGRLETATRARDEAGVLRLLAEISGAKL